MKPLQPLSVIYRIALCTALLFSPSCENVENPIPVMRVYLQLDLTFEDKALKAIPSCKTYTIGNINLAQGESAGFGGVMVVHTMMDEYKAFDLACPHELKASISVVADKEILYAICPVCGTKYDIGFGTGAPYGVSRHYLRLYTARLNGNKLVITN